MSDARVFNTDCITGMREHLGDASVRLVVTSIPFGALFAYSAKPEDIGNTRDGVDFLASQFGLHMRFFMAELERVLSPGCIAAIHVQQLNTTQLQHGHQGIRDFVGDVVKMARLHGLNPHGEVAIPKNPQRIAQVRKLHSLLFVSGMRDARALAPANNDYVLWFRKPGDDGRPVPALADARKNPDGWVSKEEWIRWARGVWEGAWDCEPEMVEGLDGYAEALDAYLRQEWQHSAVWNDILEVDVLDGWRSARGNDEERHVCPLQLSVIRRCLKLYSLPGDLVVDPFMGIGSTAYVCIQEGRDCIGFELKESYHRLALRNVERARELARGSGQAALFEEAVAS